MEIYLFAHGRDCNSVILRGSDGELLAERQHDYFPTIPEVCRGDDLKITVDVETGQILNWPKMTKEEWIELIEGRR